MYGWTVKDNLHNNIALHAWDLDRAAPRLREARVGTSSGSTTDPSHAT